MLVPQAAHFLTYGPAAGAMVTAAGASSAFGINATARAGQVTAGSGSMPLAKGTRLVNAPATFTGVASVVLALPKARARAGGVIRVNTLGQDDVTGAVLEAEVEDGLTLRQVMRLLLAQAAGDATGLNGSSVVFKGRDGSTTRIAGTLSGGARTITTINGG
jgi:hypothetical protein